MLFFFLKIIDNDDLSKSPNGSYTDEIPIRGLNSMSLEKPPYLPPQLLNIVLNKDTMPHNEPALLPEPNHVMLKHLYALSIRVSWKKIKFYLYNDFFLFKAVPSTTVSNL
jgi:hypothetical protein